jgi:hypothetical protein
MRNPYMNPLEPFSAVLGTPVRNLCPEFSHGFSQTARGRRQQETLSRPSSHQSTPIATTALPFKIQLNSEGAVSVQFSA